MDTVEGQSTDKQLPCDVITTRLLIKKGWIDQLAKKALPAAFLLPLKDLDTGLSLFYDLPPEQCASRMNKVLGLASLHVGSIRSLMLDVYADDVHHAYIVGLPCSEVENLSEEDAKRAERLAVELAKQSRLYWTKPL